MFWWAACHFQRPVPILPVYAKLTKYGFENLGHCRCCHFLEMTLVRLCGLSDADIGGFMRIYKRFISVVSSTVHEDCFSAFSWKLLIISLSTWYPQYQHSTTEIQCLYNGFVIPWILLFYLLDYQYIPCTPYMSWILFFSICYETESTADTATVSSHEVLFL